MHVRLCLQLDNHLTYYITLSIDACTKLMMRPTTNHHLSTDLAVDFVDSYFIIDLIDSTIIHAAGC